MVTTRIQHGVVDRVAVGFPGDLIDGVVTDPANLARVGGPGTAIDEAVANAWRNFDVRAALKRAGGVPCVVVNDAVATAAGCDVSRGRHLVITLGTGLGVALVVDGEMVPIDDVGGTAYGDITYDEAGVRAKWGVPPDSLIVRSCFSSASVSPVTGAKVAVPSAAMITACGGIAGTVYGSAVNLVCALVPTENVSTPSFGISGF